MSPGLARVDGYSHVPSPYGFPRLRDHSTGQCLWGPRMHGCFQRTLRTLLHVSDSESSDCGTPRTGRDEYSSSAPAYVYFGSCEIMEKGRDHGAVKGEGVGDSSSSGPAICEECETTSAIWACDVCRMEVCDMCFDVLHRKGKRAKHPKRPRAGAPTPADVGAPVPVSPSGGARKSLASYFVSGGLSASAGPTKDSQPIGSSRPMIQRAKYIPLRLSYEERKSLRLVEAALTACDYTARVDRVFKRAPQREQAQLRQISAVLEGLIVSLNYENGRNLVDERDFQSYEAEFQTLFEIARRHKIMNPEKMRGEYGKLAYLLQDAVSPAIKAQLHVNVVGGIKTVYTLLEEKRGLKMLEDPHIYTATQEILPDPGKSRHQIQQEIKKKERAIEYFANKYQSSYLSDDEVRLCLYSICDNNSFLNSNRVPIDKIIEQLSLFFSPDKVEGGYSLSIVQGQDGARLTHSHERQYNFALQSMTLWREIMDDMFRLWCLAEEDLLSEDSSYELRDTGQGLHRVQQCPRTFHAMQEILYKTQRRVGNWIGSSVIHLGDHNVPNALVFIDKYTQVPTILGPIIICLEQVDRIYKEDDGIHRLIDKSFGGLRKLKLDIVFDFVKCAFDGSGGDNFFDAGSCIDGRLTSAWNWCSQLSHKPFYPIFKLTGFTGFDGEFDK